MPAEKVSSCQSLQQSQPPVNKNEMNKVQACDFRIFVNPAVKHKCITEDENFFNELRDSNFQVERPKNGPTNKCANFKFESVQETKKNAPDVRSSANTDVDSCDKNNLHLSSEEVGYSNYQFKSKAELQEYSIQALKTIINDFASAIEDASSQLVSLLQENDTLQQESEARNIAIEQLLKLTVKQTEVELRPVQMSVLSPSVTVEEYE